jgi:putative peptidoglycan lipid II flippase
VDLRRDYSQGWRLNQSSQNHTGKIARAAGSMSVAVLLSRVLGLVREQVLAALFGAGYSIDAFVVAFRIPNLLRDLFAEGALSTAFVTVFTQHDQKLGPERTWRLANNVIAFLALLVGGISLLGMFFSPQLVDLMAPDFGLVPGKLQLTWTMTRIMFPFLLLVSLAAVVMGILNTKEKFFIPALSSSFFNLGSILVGVGLAVLLPRFGFSAIVGMAWGTLAGGLFQLLIQIPQLRRVGFRLQLVFDWRDAGLRQILRLMLPAVVGLSASQINIFINTFYASSCQQGSVSWLNYAYRLVHLPQGLFGVALSVATLPMVSRFAAHRNIPAMKEAFSSSLSLAMLLALPAAAGLIALANPICAVIFQHGRFSTWDTHQTAAAVVLYSLGLFAFAAVKIIVPVFYALDDTKIPVMGSFITVAFNILIINFTINALGHRAIALSTSLSMMVNLLFLASMLYRKVEGYAVRDLLTTLVKVTGAAAIMGVTVWGFYSVATVWLGKSLFKEMLALGGSIFLGMALYLALIYPLNIPEFQILLGGLKARLGRSRTG